MSTVVQAAIDAAKPQGSELLLVKRIQIPTAPERQTASGRGPNVSIAGSFFCIHSIATYTFTSPFSFNSAAENGPFFFWFLWVLPSCGGDVWNSQIGQAAPEFLELFSRKAGSGLLDARGAARLALLPGTVGQRVVEAVFSFWKNIPENRAGKIHTGKAARSARQARPRAINDKGQVIGSARWFGCLSATVEPAQRQKNPVDKDEREQYCTEAILRPCAYRESPNGT
jgi:hypothetical protein